MPKKPDRNEAGDRYETQVARNPEVPVAAPRPAVPVCREPGRNESGDPVDSKRAVRHGRNESGDLPGGGKNPDHPLPAPATAAPLVAGAIGRNESGDPIFPKYKLGRNESGDYHQSAPVNPAPPPPRPRCVKCGGSGKAQYQDRRGHPGVMACPTCDGSGEAR